MGHKLYVSVCGACRQPLSSDLNKIYVCTHPSCSKDFPNQRMVDFLYRDIQLQIRDESGAMVLNIRHAVAMQLFGNISPYLLQQTFSSAAATTTAASPSPDIHDYVGAFLGLCEALLCGSTICEFECRIYIASSIDSSFVEPTFEAISLILPDSVID
eukprot:TRINITY_DN11789_c0_g1_i1.p1 TRINITY_DN11789_c0_g1~~TRINITY_DN11789_c0_g1_i1.p1  ORF type:complete len:167 (-),score=9.07 TRINITY_DN11789_c0_g1_i1:207-677(-)